MTANPSGDSSDRYAEYVLRCTFCGKVWESGQGLCSCGNRVATGRPDPEHSDGAAS
jgi:rRNA maturation endonuclease Nob1